jgi:hypothetical protein
MSGSEEMSCRMNCRRFAPMESQAAQLVSNAKLHKMHTGHLCDVNKPEE